MFVAYPRVGNRNTGFPVPDVSRLNFPLLVMPRYASLCLVDAPPHHTKFVDMFALRRERATRQGRSGRHVGDVNDKFRAETRWTLS